jgi:LmbE family N-acetylglucosaminyl deacetylase
LETEKPDIVFTHWPIDSHKDHQAASLLTIQTWLRLKQKFTLYFFEVCAGEQTLVFHPTGFIDISDTREQKGRLFIVIPVRTPRVFTTAAIQQWKNSGEENWE